MKKLSTKNTKVLKDFANNLRKQSAFYEKDQKDFKPIGADAFIEYVNVLKNDIKSIYNMLNNRMLYDLSNQELDNIKSRLNSIISWAKDAKAVMKDKQNYSGKIWQKGPAEFKADKEQKSWNDFIDTQ